MISARPPLPLALAGVLVAGAAHAGGPELDAFALAIVEDPTTVDGGALDGPASSRATWFFLGGVRPFDGQAMAAFSTGVLGTPLSPGTDLAAGGPADDLAGIRLALEAPAGARSLRFAYRVIASPTLAADPDSRLDLLRVEAADDPLALDPWLGGPMGPESEALALGDATLLDGTPYAGAHITPWLEAVVPVQPFVQVRLLFEIADGGGSATGDLVALLDGVRFDTAIPNAVPPGIVPRLDAVHPARLAEGIAGSLVIEGDRLPADGLWALVDDEGASVIALDVLLEGGPRRVILEVPPLEAHEPLGLRLSWGPGASLTWPQRVRIATPAPSIARLVPDVAPLAGGGPAVVLGGGFHGVSAVELGGRPVTTWSTPTPGRIELVLPPGASGPASLTVTAAGGIAEHEGAVTYAARAEDGDEDPTLASGPSLASCDTGRGPAAPWLGFVPVLLWRRRCAS